MHGIVYKILSGLCITASSSEKSLHSWKLLAACGKMLTKYMIVKDGQFWLLEWVKVILKLFFTFSFNGDLIPDVFGVTGDSDKPQILIGG